MGSSIRLSPKHGVNPCMTLCFFCGEPKNEIALLGRINRTDDEAPKEAVIDYIPCEKCQENMKKGITLVGATTENPNHIPPIQPGIYPTGRWMVVRENLVKTVFLPDAAETIIRQRKALVDDSILEEIFKLIDKE